MLLWCILVCHPHLTIIICRTAVWAQACGSEHKTSFVIIVHLWFICVLDCFLIPFGVWVGAVSRHCHFWYRLFGPQQPWQIFVRCVLVNTLQYHDTVDFVQDSETEDPQLVAERARGTKPWQDNGKEFMTTQQWDHGLDRIHLQVYQRQHWRTHTDNGNAICRQPHRCRRTSRGGWLLKTAQKREPDCSRGRHGRCVGAG